MSGLAQLSKDFQRLTLVGCRLISGFAQHTAAGLDKPGSPKYFTALV